MITAVLIASLYALVAAAFVVLVRRQTVDGFEDTKRGFVAIAVSQPAGTLGSSPRSSGER